MINAARGALPGDRKRSCLPFLRVGTTAIQQLTLKDLAQKRSNQHRRAPRESLIMEYGIGQHLVDHYAQIRATELEPSRLPRAHY
ncbi:hypothetical protein NDU88_002793 [Pleurodeles waltl]|uniref:Uncharacterized protein n=1 Tax=Pleurodeles waltl TaxID=8319 RepID=A0AAV7MPD1_PLEWA|nr:hypothetical protein NDU88_002793 [Pleurodeles waltl]